MVDKDITDSLFKVESSARNILRSGDTKELTYASIMEIHKTLSLLAQKITVLQEQSDG